MYLTDNQNRLLRKMERNGITTCSKAFIGHNFSMSAESLVKKGIMRKQVRKTGKTLYILNKKSW